MGFPLCGRAGAACGRNSREGSDGTPSRFAAGASAQICEGVARKAATNVVPCAGAHDRQTFPNGERGGQTRMTGKRSPKGNAGGQGAQPQQVRMTGKRPRLGTLGGKGGAAPNPKRWRCGGRGERAGARGLPQRHRSSSREAARSSAKFTAPARTWGFPKGGVQHPTLVRGFARG